MRTKINESRLIPACHPGYPLHTTQILWATGKALAALVPEEPPDQ
jgi:hypothetical protein